ncbi:MAG: hypothetical protein A3G76_08235 [Acidobacteria bacterium RIFCSPLOWO2_12_FULL_65_11]|nr:MAG: hypothetical protein A3H95_14345 [Acidobacteria bacterium RIFCSPLOWO2_02_FULL_64_15]OFW28394.1 MAG: hypothetical protein A3G76_08235 [Acidobacteria bacterium RIFCSPLOWO2_12_FULL_65_11]
MSFVTRLRVRGVPIVLAIVLAGGSLADCVAALDGADAQMACCASGHHDSSCPAGAKAAPCCEDGQLQQSHGFVAAKQERIALPSAVPFSAVVAAAIPVAPARVRLVSSTDTGPPFSPTRRHIVLSVFLI